jgi:hypothetical protein
METFKSEYEDGVQVKGVGGAYNVSAKTAILFVYDTESEVFLKLKFTGNKSVKVNRYFKGK